MPPAATKLASWAPRGPRQWVAIPSPAAPRLRQTWAPGGDTKVTARGASPQRQYFATYAASSSGVSGLILSEAVLLEAGDWKSEQMVQRLRALVCSANLLPTARLLDLVLPQRVSSTG